MSGARKISCKLRDPLPVSAGEELDIEVEVELAVELEWDASAAEGYPLRYCITDPERVEVAARLELRAGATVVSPPVPPERPRGTIAWDGEGFPEEVQEVVAVLRVGLDPDCAIAAEGQCAVRLRRGRRARFATPVISVRKQTKSGLPTEAVAEIEDHVARYGDAHVSVLGNHVDGRPARVLPARYFLPTVDFERLKIFDARVVALDRRPPRFALHPKMAGYNGCFRLRCEARGDSFDGPEDLDEALHVARELVVTINPAVHDDVVREGIEHRDDIEQVLPLAPSFLKGDPAGARGPTTVAEMHVNQKLTADGINAVIEGAYAWYFLGHGNDGKDGPYLTCDHPDREEADGWDRFAAEELEAAPLKLAVFNACMGFADLRLAEALHDAGTSYVIGWDLPIRKTVALAYGCDLFKAWAQRDFAPDAVPEVFDRLKPLYTRGPFEPLLYGRAGRLGEREGSGVRSDAPLVSSEFIEGPDITRLQVAIENVRVEGGDVIFTYRIEDPDGVEQSARLRMNYEDIELPAERPTGEIRWKPDEDVEGSTVEAKILVRFGDKSYDFREATRALPMPPRVFDCGWTETRLVPGGSAHHATGLQLTAQGLAESAPITLRFFALLPDGTERTLTAEELFENAEDASRAVYHSRGKLKLADSNRDLALRPKTVQGLGPEAGFFVRCEVEGFVVESSRDEPLLLEPPTFGFCTWGRTICDSKPLENAGYNDLPDLKVLPRGIADDTPVEVELVQILGDGSERTIDQRALFGSPPPRWTQSYRRLRSDRQLCIPWTATIAAGPRIYFRVRHGELVGNSKEAADGAGILEVRAPGVKECKWGREKTVPAPHGDDRPVRIKVSTCNLAEGTPARLSFFQLLPDGGERPIEAADLLVDPGALQGLCVDSSGDLTCDAERYCPTVRFRWEAALEAAVALGFRCHIGESTAATSPEAALQLVLPEVEYCIWERDGGDDTTTVLKCHISSTGMVDGDPVELSLWELTNEGEQELDPTPFLPPGVSDLSGIELASRDLRKDGRLFRFTVPRTGPARRVFFRVEVRGSRGDSASEKYGVFEIGAQE